MAVCQIARGQSVNKRRKNEGIGGSLTTALIHNNNKSRTGLLLLLVVMSFSHLSMLSPNTFSALSPPLSLIFYSPSVMSTAPDAMCWHPQINAKVNGKTKGAK